MATLQIQLLGDFSLSYNRQPVTALYQPRQQSLLAYLLLHHAAPQPRQHLAFCFWPDSTEGQARANLRQLLHDLRHGLPAAATFLQIDNQSLQWRTDASYTLDVVGFEQRLNQAEESSAPIPLLEQAVQLYRAPLLPSCYDDWILPERERLNQRYIAALARLTHLLENERAYARAIDYAQRLLRAEPLHEESYRCLMRLHALCGARAQALHLYHACTARLQRELGVAPDHLTQALYQQLLAAETTPLPPSAQAPGPAIRLVGRQREWQQLQWAWQRANRGESHCCLLAGEAGIGKTRLREELTHWAQQQGIASAVTRAYAAEGNLVYAPVVEWLRSSTIGPAVAQLAPVWREEIARLLPELATKPAIASDTPRLDEPWQRQRLFEGLARAILLVKAPLLLFIDDLQWCDRETIEWLHYLLRFDPKARLLLVATMRPEELTTDHPLTMLLLSLRRAAQITTVELAPLSATETNALAVQLTGGLLDAQTSSDLFQQTQGNPLFIVELIRAQQQSQTSADQPLTFAFASQASDQGLPLKIQATIQARLAMLSPVARQLAEYAATAGRTFSVALLSALGVMDDVTLMQGLDELWQRRLIREQDRTTYDFSHAYLREVTYGAIGPIRRRLLHRQIAQALASMHAAALDPIYSELAIHYEQAGDLEQAVTCHQRAAAVARQRFAYAEVIIYLQKCRHLLELLPITNARDVQHLDMLLHLGQMWTVVKSFGAPEVAAVYAEAQTICRRVNQADRASLTLRGLWNYWAQGCAWAKAAEVEADLFLLAQQTDHPIHFRRAYWCRGTALFHQGHFQAAAANLQYALALSRAPRQTHDPYDPAAEPAAAIHHRLAPTLWLLGYPEQAQEQIAAALTIARRATQPLQQVFTLTFALWLARANQQPQTVQQWLDELTALPLSEPMPVHMCQRALSQGWLLTHAGNQPAGIARLQEGLQLYQQGGTVLFEAHESAWLVEAYLWAARYTEGLALVNDLLSRAAATDNLYWSAELYRLQGELRRGQDPTAVTLIEGAFQQAIDLALSQGAKMLELRATVSLARFWQSIGKGAAAHAMLNAIYGWFTEGFALADLQAAKTLLSQLGGASAAN